MKPERVLRVLAAAVAVTCLMSFQACCSTKPCRVRRQSGPRASAYLKPNDPGMIVVNETGAGHWRIEKLLKALRASQPRSYANDDALAQELEGGAWSPDELYPGPAVVGRPTAEDVCVYSPMQNRVHVTFERTPLESVVASLQQKTGVSYLLITRDVPPDGAPVTLDFEGSLELILNHIGTLTGLYWRVRDGVIEIGALASLVEYDVRVYPVRDLLIPVEDLRSGEPIRIDERNLKERAEALLYLIHTVCFEDP